MSKERLVELLEEAKIKALGTVGSLNNGWGAWYADYLLANGVIELPCKVGDKVYWLKRDPETYEWYIYHSKVDSVRIYDDTTFIYTSPICFFSEKDIGKTVFLTREEAEARRTRYDIL